MQIVYKDEERPTENKLCQAPLEIVYWGAKRKICQDGGDIDHILVLDERADPNDPHRDYILADFQAD